VSSFLVILVSLPVDHTPDMVTTNFLSTIVHSISNHTYVVTLFGNLVTMLPDQWTRHA